MKAFAQAPVSPSALEREPQCLSRVMLATPGVYPAGTTCRHPAWWGLAGAGGHTLSMEWPGFASALPGCPQAGLLRASSASCSQEERTERRRPGAWPSFCLPQLVPGSTSCRPRLSAVQPPAPPHSLFSFLFPFCTPSHASLY